MNCLTCTDCGLSSSPTRAVRRCQPLKIPLCLRCFRRREEQLIKEWNEWFRALAITRDANYTSPPKNSIGS